MKRMLILAMILIFSLSLIACGSTVKEEPEPEVETQAEETTEPEETPAATQSTEAYTAPTAIPTATPEPITVVLQSVPLNRMSEGDIEKHAELGAYAREILAMRETEEAVMTDDVEIIELPWIYEPVEHDNEKIAQGLGFTVYTFVDIDDQVNYRAWGQKPTYEGEIEAEGFYEISFEETDDGMALVFDGLTAEPVDLEAEKERYPKREGEEEASDVETQDDSATVPAYGGDAPAPEAPVNDPVPAPDPVPEPDPAPDTGGDSGKEPGEIDITTGPNGEDMQIWGPDYDDPSYVDPGVL